MNSHFAVAFVFVSGFVPYRYCSGFVVSGALAVARYLCRLVPECGLYGKTALDKSEVSMIFLRPRACHA